MTFLGYKIYSRFGLPGYVIVDDFDTPPDSDIIYDRVELTVPDKYVRSVGHNYFGEPIIESCHGVIDVAEDLFFIGTGGHPYFTVLSKGDGRPGVFKLRIKEKIL